MPRRRKLTFFLQKLNKIVGYFLLFLFFYSFFLHYFSPRYHAQIAYYRQYIQAEENFSNDPRIKKGAQTWAEIQALEDVLREEIQDKLKKQGKIWEENPDLAQAKTKIKQLEEEKKKRQTKQEKAEREYQKIASEKDPLGFSWEEEKATADYLLAKSQNEWIQKKWQAEFKELRKKVVVNLQTQLKKANLSVTNLNIELEEKGWQRRSLVNSIIFDPLRFFLIQPWQWVAPLIGVVGDILLKALLTRLLLNWVSYPPPLFSTPPAGESSEITNLLALEKERERAKQQLELMKQSLFNFTASLLLVSVFSLHPFAFDRSDSFLSSKQVTFFPWIIIYVAVSFFSQFLTISNYQKIAIQDYLSKNWIWLVIAFLFSWFFYLQPDRFGAYLFALASETFNFFLNLVKWFSQQPKKKKWN